MARKGLRALPGLSALGGSAMTEKFLSMKVGPEERGDGYIVRKRTSYMPT